MKSAFEKYPDFLEVNGNSFRINYEVGRRLSSTVRIKKGEVCLRLSRFAIGRKRDEMVLEFLGWARKRLEKAGGDFFRPEYMDGGRIVLHNKVYELRVERGSKRNRIKGEDAVLKVFLVEGADDVKLRDLVEKYIMRDQKAYLEEVVEELNQLYFQEDYGVLRFKRMGSRFGSCSSKRNLNIAFRLLFAPREVFKYVCVHELAHLKEFNHSKRFWALVEEAMPNYKESEKWLKENGFLLG